MDKSTNKLQNNINNPNIESIPGMINHAPTNWMLMKNSKTTLGKIVCHFKARAIKIIHDSSKDHFMIALLIMKNHYTKFGNIL